ncbi:class I SAM-dependent methyltransferase [Solemya velum gill symbiont]|uniref:class I SAM-dependent methyltransferase n=1 Tax=Solemya velum gill symbiont TaxID=2340 RepID=UPI000998C923|nr:methyltransferase [Solemya velum gill symbiont]OOY46664.1 methyltransferase [Solemya velum gill symbiont]
MTPLDRNTIDRLRQDIHFSETLNGHTLVFHTTWGIFSPRAIDEGTRLLLEHLEIRENDRAIDLGCGYGPLGLTIAKSAPQGECLMVDKDFVAVEYANANAARNHIDNASAMLSDGLKHIDRQQKFTLAVTNLPAKTSNEHYYLFFQDIYEHLEPGGRIYVVVISGLRQFIKRAFIEVFGNHKKIKQSKNYTVAMATK